ncbi:hypothetical protein [Glutamicibacter sp.]|uniref:hypothetical protein n=1 Tax=Glutamicibacter sp. TaxID=1931995 RepID=UPI0028BDEB09|nr:hypothetical protein [Glutamicibacter sp.]
MSLEITVHTKDNCQQCLDTKRSLGKFKVLYRTVHVPNTDIETIEKMRAISDQMGIALTMPYVKVVDSATGDTEEWFGHRPDLIVEHIIAKRNRANR